MDYRYLFEMNLIMKPLEIETIKTEKWRKPSIYDYPSRLIIMLDFV